MESDRTADSVVKCFVDLGQLELGYSYRTLKA